MNKSSTIEKLVGCYFIETLKHQTYEILFIDNRSRIPAELLSMNIRNENQVFQFSKGKCTTGRIQLKYYIIYIKKILVFATFYYKNRVLKIQKILNFAVRFHNLIQVLVSLMSCYHHHHHHRTQNNN